eukprot:COSAG05_NODE_233_length_13251_cov_30.223920_4_plen_875_part_00
MKCKGQKILALRTRVSWPLHGKVRFTRQVISRTMATTAEVVKSPADQRMYRHVTLENKLQVLLIHDAVTEKSSAALDVHVGHFSDPEEVAGLAHFCEHMLFLGTEKYPDEAEYNQYLGKHGGMSNAYTSTENTNYYFDVKQEHFGGALDRFAQFFVAPLFTREATDRELNAIESENSKNLQNDMWRSFQLEKSLSSPGHPFHKFGTGSNQTLIDMPRANGVDIRDELIDFHSKYYSANLMRLVILGREPLDELQTMATSMFSGIPNKDAAQPSFGDTTPYGLEQRSRIVKVVPVKEMKVLQMTWPLPPQEAHYKAKATRYFGHLTGHEGAGSILALLKKEGWADGLSAGEGSSASDFSSFTISIELTTEGLENYEQVAAIVFQYIGMLHREGISKRVWEEEQAVAAMSFRFLEKGEPASTTSRYAGWMQQYPPTETLTGAYLFSNFDLEHMEAVQKCLNVESCMLTLQAQELEAETTYEERWYKTKYIAQPISPETLASFKQAMGAPRDADLFMPPENLFIPKDFELKPAPEGVGTGPALLVDTPLLKLWHTNLSHKFKKPKAIVHVDLSTPVAYYSPTNAVLCRLFSKMVEDGLNEFAYEAEVAGLHYELYSTTEGMRLALSGYNDKILLLLDAVCKKVATFDDWAEQQRFDLLKEQTRREYSNFFLNQPYEIARYMQSQLLTLQKWHMQNYLEALPGLDLPELKTFSAQLLSQLCITMLVGGNLTEAEARAAATTVETSLTPAPLTALVESQIPRERAIKLEVGKDLVYSLPGTQWCRCISMGWHHVRSALTFMITLSTPGYNAEEDNGAAVLFCEVSHRVVRLEACTDLLVQVANKPAFEILRTKQQLGYIVFTYPLEPISLCRSTTRTVY